MVTTMTDYQTLILAVDLSDESFQVAERAKRIGGNAALHLVHVIEPISFAYGGDIPMDFSSLQDELHKQARSQLAKFAAQFAIPEKNQHLLLGRPESEVHALAEEINADLIVVGSHGRHGLALILGSTANGIIHGAKCDVLAVRVGQ